MTRNTTASCIVLACCVAALTWAQTETPPNASLSDAAWTALDEGDFASALPEVKRAAEAGDKNAMLYYALMFQIGAAVEMDTEAQALWLERAADAGNGTAALELIGSGKDQHPHHKTWKALAANNDAHTRRLPKALATRSWGLMSANFPKSIQWNMNRAEAGDPTALFNLSKFTLFAPAALGRTVDDYPEALRAAAAAGSLSALEEISLYLAIGILGFEKDEQEARRYRRLAAEAGVASVQVSVGLNLVKGEGYAQDVAAGLELLERAADRNDTEALEKLGDLFSAGEYVDRDYARALRYRDRGAALDHAACLNDAAWQYENGHGTAVDKTKAFAYLNRSHELGSEWATYRLGQYYRFGDGVKQDIERGVALVRTAAEKGSETAMRVLGWIYFEGEHVSKNDEIAFEWMEKAAQEGDSSAQSTLGWWLINGVGIEADPAEAVTWFEFAARDGNVDAARMLWGMHLGQHGGTADPEKATQWRRRAAELGAADARIPDLAHQTRNGSAEERRAALDALATFSDDEDPGALLAYALGLIANRQLERTPDDHLIERLQALADGGSTPARSLLGQLLAIGRRDLERDVERGHALLLEAAEAGDTGAQLHLHNFYDSDWHPLYDPVKAKTWRARFEAQSPSFASAMKQYDAREQPDPRPTAPSDEELARLRARHADRTGESPVIPVFQTRPVYPPSLRFENVTGEVIVQFVVNTEGDPEDVRAIRSSHPGFEDAAVEAVKTWRFVPMLKDGRPLSSSMRVPVIFNIVDQ